MGTCHAPHMGTHWRALSEPSLTVGLFCEICEIYCHKILRRVIREIDITYQSALSTELVLI